MLLALLVALAAAPLYWLLVPAPARRDALAVMSLVALGLYDVSLPLLVLALTALLHFASLGITALGRERGRLLAGAGLAALVGLFVANKLLGRGGLEGALASQSGLALLGMSYFVLKAGSILIETQRGLLAPPGFLRLARWLLFFPIYPSGPIEGFKHFDDQQPRIERERILRGLERILFGCVRALVFSAYLAEWTAPVLEEPAAYSLPVLLAAVYGISLRIYFDFAGYSDIAIGLAALYGYEIQENFDRPLIQRNIVALWQRWHMTLTGWLRIYLFTPWTRALMLRGRSWHYPAIITGQLVTMGACGLWHDLSWGFALWGLMHGAALVVAGLFARDLGRKLPPTWVPWWRASRTAHVASVALTLTVFSAINVFAVAPLEGALAYYARIWELL